MLTTRGSTILLALMMGFMTLITSEAQPQLRSCCQVPEFGRRQCCFEHPEDRCCGRGGHQTPPPPFNRQHCCDSPDIRNCCMSGPPSAIDSCCLDPD
ncbi:hypothetical protein KC19_6G082000 [Ceratodon purpureus]|uniref:Uncharacterized protein n=1 Tax=Ceratodon purpureus TaxID=3225 RepID=A0A8T0HFA4_CERPU|nr:hypothetical protein KC19_6G082000 [Ceratodon purpureus]